MGNHSEYSYITANTITIGLSHCTGKEWQRLISLIIASLSFAHSADRVDACSGPETAAVERTDVWRCWRCTHEAAG